MNSAVGRRISVEKHVTRKWNGRASLPVDRTVQEGADLTLHPVADTTHTRNDEIVIVAIIDVVVDRLVTIGDGAMMTSDDHMVAIDVNQ